MNTRRWLWTGGIVIVGGLFLLASQARAGWLWGLAFAALALFGGLGLLHLSRSLWEEWTGVALFRRSPARERAASRRRKAESPAPELSQAGQPAAPSSEQPTPYPEQSPSLLPSPPEPVSGSLQHRTNGHKKHSPEL